MMNTQLCLSPKDGNSSYRLHNVHGLPFIHYGYFCFLPEELSHVRFLDLKQAIFKKEQLFIEGYFHPGERHTQVQVTSPYRGFSVAQSHLTLCNPIGCSTPGFPVLHYPPEFVQIHVH